MTGLNDKLYSDLFTVGQGLRTTQATGKTVALTLRK